MSESAVAPRDAQARKSSNAHGLPAEKLLGPNAAAKTPMKTTAMNAFCDAISA
jgi:hypothetical protein